MTPWPEQAWVPPEGPGNEVLRGLGRMARDLGVGHFSFFLEWERFPRSLPKAQRRFLVEAGSHGLRNWLVIPVQGALGSFGVFCLLDPDAGRLRSAVRGQEGRLWATALDVHGFLLGESGTGQCPMPELNEGERTCLGLALEGHSTERIAAATGWSRSTVNQHVSKAQRKLGCGNRFEAAVRAMRLGIFNLP